MICLHISAHFDGEQIHFTADRMEREDARPNERAVIDMVHDGLKLLMACCANRCGPIKEIERNNDPCA